jgi:hypothetical protein
MTEKTPGQVAYEAFYGNFPAPAAGWDELAAVRPRETCAWEVAAAAAWAPERDRLTAALEENDRLAARVTELESKLTGALGERDHVEHERGQLAARAVTADRLAAALDGRRIPVTIVDHAGGDEWLAEPVSPGDLAAQLIAAADPQNRP